MAFKAQKEQRRGGMAVLPQPHPEDALLFEGFDELGGVLLVDGIGGRSLGLDMLIPGRVAFVALANRARDAHRTRLFLSRASREKGSGGRTGQRRGRVRGTWKSHPFYQFLFRVTPVDTSFFQLRTQMRTPPMQLTALHARGAVRFMPMAAWGAGPAGAARTRVWRC